MLLTEHSSVRPKTPSSDKWKMIALNIPSPSNEKKEERKLTHNQGESKVSSQIPNILLLSFLYIEN